MQLVVTEADPVSGFDYEAMCPEEPNRWRLPERLTPRSSSRRSYGDRSRLTCEGTQLFVFTSAPT